MPLQDSSAGLREALKSAQLEVARHEASECKMQDQLTEMRAMIEWLTLAVGEKPQRGCSKTRDPSPAEASIPPTLACSGANLGFDDKKQYLVGTPEEALPWIIAGIYHYVPAEYHVMLEKYVLFKTAFIKGYNAMCSTAINTMRSVATRVFDVRAEWMVRKTTKVDRAQEPVLLRFLKWDFAGQNAPYDKFPPLLYPDGVLDNTRMFQSLYIVKLLRAVLFGKESTSLDDEDANQEACNGKDCDGEDCNGHLGSRRRAKQPHHPAGPPTNAILWELTMVTPGLIAFGAVAATFLLSANEDYKKVLMTTARSPVTRETMAFYQQKLFSRDVLSSDLPDDEQTEDPADAIIHELMCNVPLDESDDDTNGFRPYSIRHQVCQRQRGSVQNCTAEAGHVAGPAPLQSHSAQVNTHSQQVPPKPSKPHKPAATAHDITRAPHHPRSAPSATVSQPHLRSVQAGSHSYTNDFEAGDTFDVADTYNNINMGEDDEEGGEGSGHEVGSEVNGKVSGEDSVEDGGEAGAEDKESENAPSRYGTRTVHVSQPPDISIINETEEPAEEDYEELEYIEIDVDDQTDHDMGNMTDAFDQESLPVRHCSVLHANPAPHVYSGPVPRPHGRLPMARSFSGPPDIVPGTGEQPVAEPSHRNPSVPLVVHSDEAKEQPIVKPRKSHTATGSRARTGPGKEAIKLPSRTKTTEGETQVSKSSKPPKAPKNAIIEVVEQFEIASQPELVTKATLAKKAKAVKGSVIEVAEQSAGQPEPVAKAPPGKKAKPAKGAKAAKGAKVSQKADSYTGARARGTE
ncbi:hypothetical protein NUW54_g160 [Trametes sanguinea]|uniref:Uncharacterized protein n=1 Tax=Trametes sanguinea TaxID=158606 RepID=A0ACC1QBD9_9APHY|nr:hypothetical protein NUW54_g160 [Trametes sanguinea]